MPAYDAYGERRAMEARQDAWGHLAPKPRKKYRGTITIAECCCNAEGRSIVNWDFGDLPSSPWLYDAMRDWVNNLEGLEEGQVYVWTGTFAFYKGRRKPGDRERDLDEGSYVFDGALTPVILAPGNLLATHSRTDDETDVHILVSVRVDHRRYTLSARQLPAAVCGAVTDSLRGARTFFGRVTVNLWQTGVALATVRRED
jgi:hypothetical protein